MRRTTLLLWMLSAAGGAVVALGVLAFGTYGVIPLVTLLLVAARLSQRSTAFGGVLFGFGAAAAFALVAAYVRCGAAGEGQAVCVAQNVTPALAIALLAFFAGVSLTLTPLLARSRTARR